MAALHVVGENLEAGHRIRLRIVAQQEIADRLIGVGEMRVRFDPDQAPESAAGAIVEVPWGPHRGARVVLAPGDVLLTAAPHPTTSFSVRVPRLRATTA